MPDAYTVGTEQLLIGGLLSEQMGWSNATTLHLIEDLKRDSSLRFPVVATEIWLRLQLDNQTPGEVGELLLNCAR